MARDNLNSVSEHSLEVKQTDSGLPKSSPSPKADSAERVEFATKSNELSEASRHQPYARYESFLQGKGTQRLSGPPDHRVSVRAVHWLRAQGDISRVLAEQVQCIDGLPENLKRSICEAHDNVAGIIENGACELEWAEIGSQM